MNFLDGERERETLFEEIHESKEVFFGRLRSTLGSLRVHFWLLQLHASRPPARLKSRFSSRPFVVYLKHAHSGDGRNNGRLMNEQTSGSERAQKALR